MRISDWSSDVCSSDLATPEGQTLASSRSPDGVRTARLTAETTALRLAVEMSASIPTPHSRLRSEEHTSELQSLMRSSYAVFCLKKKTHYYSKLSSRH